MHPATARHLAALGDATEYAAGWRDAAFTEYYFVDPNVKCVADCKVPNTTQFHARPRLHRPRARRQVLGGASATRTATRPRALRTTSSPCAPARARAWASSPSTRRATRRSALPFETPDFVEMYDTANDEWEMPTLQDGAAEQVAALHAKCIHSSACGRCAPESASSPAGWIVLAHNYKFIVYIYRFDPVCTGRLTLSRH